MNKPINIAIDAMGGENSPTKIIKGIEIHNLLSNDTFYNIYGDIERIEPLIKKTKLSIKKYKIFHTQNIIKDTDSPLSAAKKGKDTSMWLAIESLKKNESDAIV